MTRKQPIVIRRKRRSFIKEDASTRKTEEAVLEVFPATPTSSTKTKRNRNAEYNYIARGDVFL